MANNNMDFSRISEDEKINGINITNIPQYIRDKAYLTDFSETLAQLAEMIIQLGVNSSLDPDEALEWARKLQETVSQSEFDSWVATLLDGGPSIFMNTLGELQTKYPNGAPGVALVRETDPAKIYVWNGTVWEDFGDYQGIGVKDGTISMPKLDNQLKDILDSRFTNEITNGNFSNGLDSWKVANGSSAELATGGHVRVTGTGESTLPRLLQDATNGNVNGHKIYVSGRFMSENASISSLGFNIYRDDIVTYDVRLKHPEPNVWLQIGDIITLGGEGGALRVQPAAKYPSASDSKDNSFLVDDIIIMDLTELFGPGKEPTYKEVQRILGDTYFEGTLSVSELVKKEIKLANTDDDTTSNIPVNNTLPFSRDKFTAEELALLDYNSLNLIDKVGVFTRHTDPDTPTVVLSSNGDTSRLSSSLAQRTDLSEFDYIELHLNVKDQTKFSNLRVVLSTSASDHFANDNLTHRLNEVKEDGYRVLRVPMSTFFVSDGNPSLTSIETIRLVFSGGSVESPSSIEIIKISAVKGRKGAVYMQFDDGTIGQYKYAFPILEKYGLRGTIAVPTERVGKTVGLSGERPTWSQLREMQAAGWLVVSHGLDERSLNSLSDEELDRQLRVSSQMLFDRGFTFGSKCIVAPQSAWDDRVERFARKYFAISRNKSYGGGPRRDVYPQNHHRHQKVMGPHGVPIEELKSWIDEAIQYKQEVAISWHMVQPEEPAQNKTYWDATERLEAVCAYIREKIDEGVLECVTWQDTMLQSMNTQSVDAKGNEYLVSKDSDLTLLKLPIYTD